MGSIKKNTTGKLPKKSKSEHAEIETSDEEIKNESRDVPIGLIDGRPTKARPPHARSRGTRDETGDSGKTPERSEGAAVETRDRRGPDLRMRTKKQSLFFSLSFFFGQKVDECNAENSSYFPCQ